MQTKIIKLLFFVAVMLPVCFGTWGLTESSEARYAEISREMYNSGDYINPKLLGINHFHKPPLTYYITALGFYIFGVNEYGVRFFPALALLFQLLLVFRITKLLFGDRRLALSATLIYFSYPLAHAAAINLTTDCFLTTFIFASIYFYLKSRQDKYPDLFLYLFYLFCGLSFLTKGPVGILPSCLFAILYNALSRTYRRLTFHHFTALVLCIVISASWFLFLLHDNEKLFSYFVKHQLVDRVSNNSFDRTKPFWYYFAFMPLVGLPSFLLLFDYFLESIRKKDFFTQLNKILVITFFTCFIVFSASASKLVLYVLPLYLFTAILSAWHLTVMPQKRALLFRNIFFYFYLVLLLLLLIATFLPLPFRIPGISIGLSSLAGMIILYICRRQQNIPTPVSGSLIAALGMAILSFLIPVILKENELQINSVKPVAAFVHSHLKHDAAEIIVYNQFLPSLAFYTGKQIVTLNNGNEKTKRETQFEKNDFFWKNSYFDVPAAIHKTEFQNLAVKTNVCFVAKTTAPLPDSLLFLVKDLPGRCVMGKWLIYYRD